MATLRELKARIGSVASSEKITGAMKMISSAKMHKAELALRQLKPYRQQVESIIGNLLSADVEFASPLLETRDVKSIAMVVMGSDDGLCGAYNVNIYKNALTHLGKLLADYPEATITVLPVGAKVAKQVVKMAASRVKVDVNTGVDSKSDEAAVKLFTSVLRQGFIDGTYDKVDVVSMQFHSVSRQRIDYRQLLPINAAALGKDVSGVTIKPYIFEPSTTAIVDAALPLYQQAVMQDLFTQNRASEQAARVMAMQSANDNAKKLLEQLRLEYNKLRQQSITNELLDIVGGQVR